MRWFHRLLQAAHTASDWRENRILALIGLTTGQANRHGTGVPGPFFKRIFQPMISCNRTF
ncbi:hypothetical protein CFR75_01480 [Komagataeibacter xylinus]|uniref:Uncharacterized protein n=1 Tax=Komagataeibacter xylinus TaxID=28448 RepID=A0A318PNW4_KOMXY|nr:hypothetical protein CXP35_05465 [Komagataeibacter xylinus]PYD58926.1 hypothetical protein CFR75_01480 [Komagataeibacter xylinus]